ncbi:unnamed protein product [Urochloa humidicola]
MPLPKRRRGEPDGSPTAARPQEERRVYLIFDDYPPWGYSVRELTPPLPPSPRREAASASTSGEQRSFLPPIICFEASRGHPLNFATVFTAIVSTHSGRDPSGDGRRLGARRVPPHRRRPVARRHLRPRAGLRLLPVYHTPIYLPVGGDVVFALDA